MPDIGGIKINKEQQVAYTQKEEGYVISSRDWARIKSALEKLKAPSSVWVNIAWGALGTGVSCLASWFTAKDNYIFLVVGVLGVGIAALSFFASKTERKSYDASVENLEEVIMEIEDVIIPK